MLNSRTKLNGILYDNVSTEEIDCLWCQCLAPLRTFSLCQQLDLSPPSSVLQFYWFSLVCLHCFILPYCWFFTWKYLFISLKNSLLTNLLQIVLKFICMRIFGGFHLREVLLHFQMSVVCNHVMLFRVCFLFCLFFSFLPA